jgi:serine/threonine protein kinase
MDNNTDTHYTSIPSVAASESLFSFLISFSSVKLGEELGRGAFGVVYKAELNGETIACKMISKEASKGMNEDEFLQEARTMSDIPAHPNVVRLLGFCRDEVTCILSGECVCWRKKRSAPRTELQPFLFSTILIEFIGGGDLLTLLKDQNEELTATEKLKLLTQISAGMAHLHKHNLIHR